MIDLLHPSNVTAAVKIGIGATIVVDVWTVLLKYVFKIPSLSYCLVGRWFLHMPAGQFAHAGIAAAPQKPLECAVGWIAHYAIGVVFALAFVSLAPDGWLARPTLWPALLFGIVTVLFPFLVMQPAFGLGVAASRAPKPGAARLKSVTTHLVFGFGLFAWAAAIRCMGDRVWTS